MFSLLNLLLILCISLLKLLKLGEVRIPVLGALWISELLYLTGTLTTLARYIVTRIYPAARTQSLKFRETFFFFIVSFI